MELPEGGTNKLNKMLVGLDTAIVISKTDNQDLPYLIDLEAKRANKKKEKAERCRQRKINLAQATTASHAPLSPNTSVCYSLLLSIIFVGGAGIAFASNTLFSLVAGGDLLSTVSDCLSSLIASGSLLSVILYCLLSAVFGCFSFFAFGYGFLSAILDCLLSLIVDSSFLFAESNSGALSPLLYTGSWTLFLTSILSCAYCFSLSSSPFFYSSLPSSFILFTHNPALITWKRLFDQIFII